jgi:hypothetical protein
MVVLRHRFNWIDHVKWGKMHVKMGGFERADSAPAASATPRQ